MPACRASQLRSSLVSSGPLRDATCRRAIVSRQNRGTRLKRQASTVPSAINKQLPEDSSLQNKTKTILHKAESFLPRVLPVSKDLPEPATLTFWRDVLDGAYKDLNSVSEKRSARVVVYGYGEHSGASDLVTALLEEPFAPPSRNEAIRERWKGAGVQSVFYISHGFTQSGEANRLRLPSSWLQQFNVPIEIGELLTTDAPHGRIQPPIRALYSADIPVIVCNPITTPLSTILSDRRLPLAHTNALLVLTSSPNLSAECMETVSKQLPATLKVLFLDPARAVNATQTLGTNPSSSSTVQQYQDNFTGSRVSDVTSAIANKLSYITSQDASELHVLTAKELTRLSLSACRATLDQASEEVHAVAAGMSSLKDAVAELEVRSGPEVLGVDGSSRVRNAIEKAKGEVKQVMDRLSWWRIVWRVDDIADTVRTAVDRAWCRDLEDKLIFHGGRLASAQNTLAASARHLIASHKAPSPFHSPVLENHLEQLQSSPSYPVKPSSLTSPIHTRRAQMLYPTNMLHIAAQRVTLGMGGSVLGGISIAWAGWAEHLGIIGGALGTGMQAETALGAGMLVAALGVRLMVGKWDKAQQRWWRDWDRVGRGLERDLKTTLDDVVSQQVALIPRETIDGLRGIAEKRKEEVEALRDELTALEDEVKAIKSS